MPSLLHYIRRAPMKLRKTLFPARRARLHIGSGPQALQGWTNIDIARYPGVDVRLDVRGGLPFRDVEYIFAEHFIEHLDLHAAMYLLRECRRVMTDGGVLRLSTPDLEWVWASHYQLRTAPERAVADCFRLNGAFHGWGHQFLYNEATLTAMLLDAGFATVERRAYRESGHAALQNLERHERSADFDGIPDILILEASGRGDHTPAHLAAARAGFLHNLGAK
jgi:predicted SAM-dependent methyltransferase